MKIVAKSSLTLSNVNDGTITHYAYANSADGKDGFTTVYPNLNLLLGSSAKTKDGFFKNFDKVENGYGEVTIKGTDRWAQIKLSDGFSIKPRDYKPNDKYTMSMDIMFTSWNFPSGTNIGEFWIGQRYLSPIWTRICAVDLPKDPSQMLNQWIRITQTSTIPPYGDPSVNTETIFMARLAGTSEASFTIRIRKPKQEPGSTATPWMPSASEVTSADWPSYIGQYSDFSSTASTDPTKYAPWIIFKGNDGKDGIAGKDGNGIKTTVITYAISTSGTTAPTTGWTSSVPTLVKGQFLWTKTIWTYTDNSSETGYSVTYISKDGNNGKDGIAGKDGVGIKTTTITYVGSRSGTTVPTTGWTSSVPSVPAGQFLWTKTVWTYTDNTSETGYSVAMMGPKGDKGNTGANGIAGKDGVGLKNTVITYAISTNGTTAPTTGWATQVPTLIKGQYLWTKTVWTYTDNSSETGYSVTYISKDGNNGKDGIAGKDGVGLTSTSITYAGSTNGTTAPTTGWSPSVPSVPAGQFLWTKTVWRYSDNTSETGYSVAKMGNTGATGPAGPPGSTGAPGKIVSNTEPISLFKGLTWKYSGTANLTASDGTVIHPNTEYYYNGTHWMINYLSANNFEANSITADLIDAKNLTITDGEFVSTIIDGSVKTQTEIKDDHLMIYKMDTSHNDITTIALKSDSGLGMTYQNSDTSQYTSSGINLQGIFTQDNILKNGVSLTPGGVKFTQNGVSAGLNFDGTNLSSSMPIQAPNTIVKSTYFSVSGIGIRLDRMMSFVAVTFSGQASSTINTSPTINNVLPVGFRPISPYSIDYMVPGNVANSGYIYFNPDGSIRIMATINKGYYIRGTRLYITSDVYPS
ncbi:hypothetical protein P7H72_13250 [Lactococcus lactis]|uniref:hypothetical protein n=1 Tax=Lactococcus lactis TaxID=1358 RepID=UPI00288DA418|nr:hypothetical protein [Lactococcus lactis]MDT2904199.1 hypothetical protein [Lactococcus lactis]